MDEPTIDPRQGFSDHVAKFDLWAATSDDQGGPRTWKGEISAEWESEYPDMVDVWSVFRSHLETYKPSDWTNEDRRMLLHWMGRDNECEDLKEILEEFPEHLWTLAQIGLTAERYDVRWQLADSLGRLKDYPIEEPLMKYFEDPHPYVRRRTLAAIAEARLPNLGSYVAKAWSEDEEYTRKSCLWTLDSVDSPLLEQYLALGLADRHDLVVREANSIIQRRTTDTGFDWKDRI